MHRRKRVHALKRRRIGDLRLGTAYGADQSRFLARWIGILFILAGPAGAISLVFPDAPFANVTVGLVSAAVAGVVGLALLSGIFDRSPEWVFRAIFALGAVLCAAGVYAGGSPASGAQVFFMWIIPFAYGFFTLSQAVQLTGFIGIVYGSVLLIQVHEFPAIGSIGLLAGMWFLVVTTLFVLGAFVRRIRRSLRDAEARFHRAFADSAVPAGFLGTDFVFLEVNDALCQMLGRSRDELVGVSVLDFSHPDDLELSTRMHVRVRRERSVEFEKRYLRADDEVVFSAVALAHVEAEVGEDYIFGQFRDITEHTRDRTALAHRAIHDPLTSLFNRTLFLDRLATALRHEGAIGRVGVIMIDIDYFKIVNDSLGHQVGDELLRLLAPRLASAIHPSDTLARLGGDEFVVLCDDLETPLDVIDRAGRLASSLNEPVELPTGRYKVSVSIGIALASESSKDTMSVLGDADSAMYRAKALGRGRIEMYDEEMREQALQRLALEDELRAAIGNGELALEFQPVLDVDSGRVVLVETLLRWDHPTRGRMSPAEIIPLSEEIGIIDELGDWILSSALSSLETWQKEMPEDPPLLLSINVSDNQFKSATFSTRLEEALGSSTIVPGTLGVEITEPMLSARELAASTIATLKALGVVVLLGDFGTGYTSLSHLEMFAIDIVKIDQSFIARLDERGYPNVVFDAILAMGKALGIRVIAEGAESERVIGMLVDMGCSLVQGFAVARPLPRQEMTLFLEGHRGPPRLLEIEDLSGGALGAGPIGSAQEDGPSIEI